MRKGQIVEISSNYRPNVFGQKYGVVSDPRLTGLRPILGVTIPLENGMRVKAYIPKYALKPVEKEEVTL